MKRNNLPCVLPVAGGDNLGFVAMSRSNCSAGSKHQAQTTFDPRPGRPIHYMAGPGRFS